MAGERGVEETRKLYIAYLATPPDFAAKLDQTPGQVVQITEALGRIENGIPVRTSDNRMEIGSEDGTGSKIILKYDPQAMVHELMVEGEGTDKRQLMRSLMISRGALSSGDYPALAGATQAGEKLPPFKLKPKSKVNGLLRAAHLAAVYDITPSKGGRYTIDVDNPGHPMTTETWAELSKRFSYGTASFWVIGRVGDVRRKAT